MESTPKILELEWTDHTFQYGSDRVKPGHARTVGYFVEEDDDSITVAFTWVGGQGNEQQLVLKKLLTKRRTLRAAVE